MPWLVRFISANKAESEIVTVRPTRSSLSGKPRAAATDIRSPSRSHKIAVSKVNTVCKPSSRPVTNWFDSRLEVKSADTLVKACNCVARSWEACTNRTFSKDSATCCVNESSKTSSSALKAAGVLKLSSSSTPKDRSPAWIGISRLETGSLPAVAWR